MNRKERRAMKKKPYVTLSFNTIEELMSQLAPLVNDKEITMKEFLNHYDNFLNGLLKGLRNE